MFAGQWVVPRLVGVRSRYRASTPPPEALPLRALKVCPDAGRGVQRRALEPPGFGCVAFWIS